jgi:hypothetical protein
LSLQRSAGAGQAFADKVQCGPEDASEGERHDDFVVPQTPATFHEPQIPHQAVMTVAHSGETGIVSESHTRTMHWRAIQSNLDASRISGIRLEPFPLNGFICEWN